MQQMSGTTRHLRRKEYQIKQLQEENNEKSRVLFVGVYFVQKTFNKKMMFQ